MKKITLLLILLTLSIGYSQQVVLENFDGTAPTTNLKDNFGSANVSSTQAKSAPNSLQLLTSASGQPWQGAELILQSNKIDMRDATTGVGTNKTLDVDIYSDVPREFLIKLAKGDAGSSNTQESKTFVAHPGGSVWVTLTADFTLPADSGQPGYNPPNDQFSSIVFFPLYDSDANANPTVGGWNLASVTTSYIDNVTAIAGDVVQTCTDGIQNNGETDVDCGGPNCAACPPEPPTTAAPTPPARDPSNVISIFSDAYTDVTVDNFDFGLCSNIPAVSEVIIAGNATKRYLGPGCQGIDMQNNRINASAMTRLHFDFYTDEANLVGKVFNIKLVDWAGNPTDAGSTGLEINFSGFTPAFESGKWVSVDVDLTQISAPSVIGNLTRSDIAQIHITSNLANAWYDNLYMYNEPPTCDDGIQNQGETAVDCGGPNCDPCGTCDDGIQNGGETQIDCGGPNCGPCTVPPTVAAPTPPARSPGDVISIFSDAYTDVTVDNFDFGLCDGNISNQAVSEVMIAGNATQQWLKAGCQGIDMQNNRIDASTFTHLHFDFYTDNAIIGAVFNLKLVDWAGNPTEVGSTGLEVIFNGGTSQALVANEWVSVDVDITSIGGMVLGNLTRSDVAQIHITSNLPSAWYDNLYLHKNTTLGIDDVVKTSFSLYPNPTKNSWTVKSKDISISTIKVYDILGKNVLSITPNNNEATIDGSSLKSGLYFAKIETANGSSSLKLVKQ